MSVPVQQRIEQRDNALAIANEARFAWCRIRREIHALGHAAGLSRLADLIEQSDSVVLGQPVERALTRSVRSMSWAKADHIMAAAGIRIGTRRLRELSERQRAVIVDQLRNGGGR